LDSLSKAVARLAQDLGEPEGEPVPLEGGITNRNFRARFGGAEVVIRLPGKETDVLGVDREAELAATEAASRVGVGPEVIALLDDPVCLVTRFIEGDPVEAEQLRDPARLREVAEALRRVHGGEAPLPVAFSPFRVVEAYAARAQERGATIPPEYGWAHGVSERVEPALAGSEHEPVPCHNDLLAANFLRTEGGVRIVDWEYAGMGDRFFDLGNLAVNNGLDDAGEEALLAAYFDGGSSGRRTAALRLMRFMSDFREAMWGVLQGSLSDLDFDFAAYAAEHFERMRGTAEGGEFETWLEDAGAAG